MASITLLRRSPAKAHTQSVEETDDVILGTIGRSSSGTASLWGDGNTTAITIGSSGTVTTVNDDLVVSGVVRGPSDGTGLVIGAAGTGANTGSTLQLVSLTTAERDDLVEADGMMVYNTTLSQAQVRVDGDWDRVAPLTRWAEDASGNLLPDTDGTLNIGSDSFRAGTVEAVLLEAVSGPTMPTVGAGQGGVLSATSAGAGGTEEINFGGGSYEPFFMAGKVEASASSTSRLTHDAGGAAMMGSAFSASGTAEILSSATSYGTFTGGYAFKSGAGAGIARINSTGSGSFLWAYVEQSGTATSLAEATAYGAFVHGRLSGAGGHTMTGSGDGSFTQGFIDGGTGTGIIRATMAGAFAQGRSNTGGLIEATGIGAMARGSAVGTGVIRASATGAVALGSAATAETIEATAANAMQFGVGTNALADSARMGEGWRFKFTDGAPGTPANGDAWIDSGSMFVRSDGATVKLNHPTAFDAIVPDDFALPSTAFNDVSAPKSVFVRNGTYVETADVDIPEGGAICGESPGSTILDLSGGYTVTATPTSINDYSTGTVSITNGTTSVTGVGTLWNANISDGDYILLGIGDKCWYEIDTVDSDTTLTLVRTYQGQTSAGAPYEVKTLFGGVKVCNMTLSGNTAGAGLNFTNVIAGYAESLIIVDCGVGGGTPEAAFIIQDTVDSFFNTLQVKGGPHHGVEINDSNANTFDSFNVKGFAGHGVQVTGANQDCTFNSGNICANDLNGFNITGGSDETLINNCVISENNAGGVNVDSGTGDCHVRSTTLRNNATFGITFAGSGNSAEGCQISSNGTTGISVDDNCIVDGCYIRGNGVVSTANGIDIVGDNVIVSGNRVASNSGDGINITGDDCVVTGCRVIGNTGDGIEVTASADNTWLGDNVVTGHTINVNDLSVSTIHSDSEKFQFFADQLDSPINSDWIVNALAPASPDSNNAALKVRLFDDTSEEGVGFNLFIPEEAEHLVVTMASRAETAPGGAAAVVPTLYFREIPDDGAVSGTWAGTNDGSQALTAVSLPTNENFQEDREVFNLSTLGIVAGAYYQFEFTRDPGAGGDTLTGDWALLSVGLELRL